MMKPVLIVRDTMSRRDMYAQPVVYLPVMSEKHLGAKRHASMKRATSTKNADQEAQIDTATVYAQTTCQELPCL